MAPITRDEHRDRHRWLHRAFDELVTDYMRHHPDDVPTVMDLPVGLLLTWAHHETLQPTEPDTESHRDGVLLYAWVQDGERVPMPASTVGCTIDDLPLTIAATTPGTLSEPVVRVPVEELASRTNQAMRLVRCVEVETLAAVTPRVDKP